MVSLGYSILIASKVLKISNFYTENDKIYEIIGSNPSIDCVSFDGSIQSAQELILKKSYQLANRKTLLSLNGKSSLIIYDSADIDSAIESVVDGCFYANGQVSYTD